MKKRYIILILFLLVLGYFLFYPVPIEPASWTPPTAPSLEEGIYKKNNALANIQHLFDGQCAKPEDVAIDSLGRIYTGLADGRILRFDSEDAAPTEIANTGGRPLGLRLDTAGILYVADTEKGLLKVTPDGEITVLTDSFEGQRLKFADDLDIAADGTIYFSEASTKFGLKDFAMDMMEHRPNGKLLAYNPVAKTTKVVLDSLYFANGVAISPDQSYLLVNETSKYRTKKLWLTGDKKGQAEIFMDNLPGFPDGLTYGGGDLYWIAFASPRQQALDDIMPQPFIRKIVVRLPESMQVAPAHYTIILGVNSNGEVIHNLQDTNGGYSELTNVVPFKDKLYFGSLHENAIGVMDRPE